MGVIINGRYYRDDSSTAKGQFIGHNNDVAINEYNKRIFEDANYAEKITIRSECANVELSVHDNNTVETYLIGKVAHDGNLIFSVNRFSDEIVVSVGISGKTIEGELKLNVKIPKRRFKVISIKNECGDAVVGKDVKAKKLKIGIIKGNIDSNASFSFLKAETYNGNINIDVDAENDIELNVSSLNGSVDTALKNISHFNLRLAAIKGKVFNKFKENGDFFVSGNISSMNGNTTVV